MVSEIRSVPDYNTTPSFPETELLDSREALLRTVLNPVDYHYVKDTGLDKLFHYDKDTGTDGLAHILGGEIIGEKRIAKGFHHAPSGEMMSVPDPSTGLPKTRIERVVDREGNTIDRPRMAPYLAEVVVDGNAKQKLRKMQGEYILVKSTNSMFPDEYDALTIMRTVEMAIEKAEPIHDQPQRFGDGRLLYGIIGKVPLIDGTSEMAVKVVLSYPEMTVVTAYPAMKHSDELNLVSDDEVMYHATYGLAPKAGEIAIKAPEEAGHE